MWTGTVAGRIVGDAEMRQAGGSEVCSFSVAHNPGKGADAVFFDASIWGDRGAKVCEYLRKGDGITLSGTFSEREHDGKVYKQINVSDFAFGEKKREQTDDRERDGARRDSGRREERGREDRAPRREERSSGRSRDDRSRGNDDDIPF